MQLITNPNTEATIHFGDIFYVAFKTNVLYPNLANGFSGVWAKGIILRIERIGSGPENGIGVSHRLRCGDDR